MSSDADPSPPKLWILVKHKDLKAVQAALLERGLLERDEPAVYNPRIIQQEFDIVPHNAQDAGEHIYVPEKPQLASQVAVPTTLYVPSNVDDYTHPQSTESTLLTNNSVLELLGIGHLCHMVPATRTKRSDTEPTGQRKPSSTGGNELSRAVQDWHRSLPTSLSATLPSATELLSSSTWRFTKYSPLLILPAGTFSSAIWSGVFATLSTEHIESVYAHVAKGVGVTHIAEQGPIPLLQTHESSSNGASSRDPQVSCGSISTNVLRSPLGLRPLYGAFGPDPGLAAASEPSKDTFAAALWVTVKQHGIAQVFAPLYTMFANGNVNEKRRVRDLAAADLDRAGFERYKVAAADLYAGIGYFAFSYAKAGYRPVLCWELNAWSIEGFRRGAELNGWTCKILARDEELTDENTIRRALDCTFVVFHESNDRAPHRLARLRSLLPPIRHVNCGYLPSSRPSWHVALDLVDREHGGWLHVHENCDAADVESGMSREAIVASLTALERRIDGRQVRVQHVERVKSYAPGVLHCVFDAYVDPKPKGSGHDRPKT